MRLRIAVVAVLSSTVAFSARAQQKSCPSGTGALDPDRLTQDACQMAHDVFQFMAPQLGIALTGGNATLGQGGALGGLGHFALDVRANVIDGDLPDVQKFPQPSTTGSQSHTLPTKSQVVGLPTVDAAIGIFQGLSLGLTNVGGIDLLLSAAYIPTVGGPNDAVQVKPDQSLNIGFGARVGIIQESLLTPGVSVTYLRRDLPTTTIIGNSSGVTIDVTNATVKTNAVRLTASKNLVLFSLAAGVGRDNYDESAIIQGTANGFSSQQVLVKQSMTRTNYFVDASLNLFLAKVVAEVGQVTGGSVSGMVNTFSGGAADKSRLYGSIGLRIGF